MLHRSSRFLYCEPKLKSENVVVSISQSAASQDWKGLVTKLILSSDRKLILGVKASNHVTMHTFSSCIREFGLKIIKMEMYSEWL